MSGSSARVGAAQVRGAVPAVRIRGAATPEPGAVTRAPRAVVVPAAVPGEGA
ncbi:hypothetical protein [Streptomyces sp. NPDC018347]|uniref:hypothetical protein n=1 Tax=Streptomyces sp. NPDC018347 TaxID=3157193 RepID=UPI0033D37CCA